MNVKQVLIIAIPMLCVQIQSEATTAAVMLDIQEMEHFV